MKRTGTKKKRNRNALNLIQGREKHICQKGRGVPESAAAISCDADSVAGAVSQRACVYCGARVVLNPIADAVHLVHGPIGCSTYTWDIRGSLSSGPELHRLGFSTDLREEDVIFGGERKLYRALTELIERHRPAGAFVYSTCISGVIGDDLKAVCARVENEQHIPVLPVQSEGFRGNKREGYKAACGALYALMRRAPAVSTVPLSVNILGDFNLAGELWIIRGYLERMGLRVVANISGDARVADISRAPAAALNLVQCSGSMLHLAHLMQQEYGTPFIRVSWIGAEDTATGLAAAAGYFDDDNVWQLTRQVIREEQDACLPQLEWYRERLVGRKAAVYVGGAFKAVSLIRAFRTLDMKVVLVGSQTGKPEDYEEIREAADAGAVIIDDANPLELVQLMDRLGVDIFVGGVKERPMAYKLGIAFCDHNHERKRPLEGFGGMINFAREVHASIASPVWNFVPRARLAEATE